jgi:hypothetical protein
MKENHVAETIKEYAVRVSIDDKSVDIKEKVETDWKEGEANQLAAIFYRAMLGCGYEPAMVMDAFVKASGNGAAIDGKKLGSLDAQHAE